MCVCVCALSLLLSLCSCFWRSSGWALDCCPLMWHCPIEPKAVWLPLQATLSMATFHSHLCKPLTLAYAYRNLLKSKQLTMFYLEVKLPTRYLGRFNWNNPTVKCVCQITPYVSVVGPVFGGVVLWCEWSGYSSYIPTICKLACVHLFFTRWVA